MSVTKHPQNRSSKEKKEFTYNTMSTSSKAERRSLSQEGKRLLVMGVRSATTKVTNPNLLATIALKPTEKVKEAQMWSAEEDELLRNAVRKYGTDFNLVALEVPGRNKLQCASRWNKTLKDGLKKGLWEPNEDLLLKQALKEEAPGDWQAIARRVPGRNAKQCKERWTLNLDPEVRHDKWTQEEDAQLVALHGEIGGKWSVLAKRLPGRTEHAIKTRFKSLEAQAAKVRGWTVEEDRVVLKCFMKAPNLDGALTTKKLLNFRTKKQITQRWGYLRGTYENIDHLASVNQGGNIDLAEYDLKNLIPDETISSSSSSAITNTITNGNSYSRKPGLVRPKLSYSQAPEEKILRPAGTSSSSKPFTSEGDMLRQVFDQLDNSLLDFNMEIGLQSNRLSDIPDMYMPAPSMTRLAPSGNSLQGPSFPMFDVRAASFNLPSQNSFSYPGAYSSSTATPFDSRMNAPPPPISFGPELFNRQDSFENVLAEFERQNPHVPPPPRMEDYSTQQAGRRQHPVLRAKQSSSYEIPFPDSSSTFQRITPTLMERKTLAADGGGESKVLQRFASSLERDMETLFS